ncbi:MAG: hypothetical protein WBX01_13050 [Nitrososphaeraceae archaeon]|jgi:hypothetical protein
MSASQYAEYSANNNSEDDRDERNLNLVPDPLVKNDQAVVVNLGKKGMIAMQISQWILI